jgi:antitoxin YefM
MKTTYSITRAQHDFPRLVRESAGAEAIAITRHDETVAYLVSRERMEAMVETMEVLANPKAMRAIRAYERDKTTFHPLEMLDHEG